MKKTNLISVVVASCLFSGLAYAGTATESFTWAGTVPAKPVTDGLIIKSLEGETISQGTLKFDKNGELNSSTPISFKVMKYDTSTSTATDFVAQSEIDTLEYRVISFETEGTSSGQLVDLNGENYFSLLGNGVALQMNNPIAMPGNNIALSVGKNANVGTEGPKNKPEANDSILVKAVIMATNQM